jgi:hypothetical protein
MAEECEKNLNLLSPDNGGKYDQVSKFGLIKEKILGDRNKSF